MKLNLNYCFRGVDIVMLVSVITVFYNREEYVFNSIKSLLEQDYENIEIIAVDDGSTDNTLQKLNSFSDKRLKVITHNNMGFVKSIINAVTVSNGEIIAIHGSGDISYENRISKQVSILEENKDVGVVGCFVKKTNLVNKRVSFHRPVISPDINLTEQLFKHNFFTHGEVMFRKELYTKVGGYREVFKYSQDYDLWLRMSLVTNFNIIPEVLYERFTLTNGVSNSVEKSAIQTNLGELGRQSIKLKMKGNEDLVDKYGFQAAFFKKRSQRVAKDLFKTSLRALSKSEIQSAKRIVRWSINERMGLYNTLLFLFLKIVKEDSALLKELITLLYKVKIKRDKSVGIR